MVSSDHINGLPATGRWDQVGGIANSQIESLLSGAPSLRNVYITSLTPASAHEKGSKRNAMKSRIHGPELTASVFNSGSASPPVWAATAASIVHDVMGCHVDTRDS